MDVDDVADLDDLNEVDEAWSVDFWAEEGPSGFVRLARVGDRCWYWCYLVGDDVGLVAVRDHDVVPPRRPDLLEVRADALWAELVCETRDEHWGIALEAFGVRLDRAGDAWVGEIGERVAVGLDLEWEVATAGVPSGVVRGEVLLERDRYPVDGAGTLVHAVAPDTGWPDEWTGACRMTDGRWVRLGAVTDAADAEGIAVPVSAELDDGTFVGCRARAVVPVPLRPDQRRSRHLSRRGPALVRVLTDVAAAGDTGAEPVVTGTGWVEVLQS